MRDKIRRKHRVSLHEVEEAFTTSSDATKSRKVGKGRYAFYSRTSGGRYILSVVDMTDGCNRDDLELLYLEPPTTGESGRTKQGAVIVTSREMGEEERRWYNSLR